MSAPHKVKIKQARAVGIKKGGAGAKGAWGKPGDELNAPTSFDRHDPNYDSGNEDDYVLEEIEVDPRPEPRAQEKFVASIQSMNNFKRAVRVATDEFLASYDRDEFVRCVRDLNMLIYHQEVPRLLLTYSLDKSEDQRKKVSSLLQYLFEKDVVTREQMRRGFSHVYSRLSDLLLDVPNADVLLQQYVSRAVAAEFFDDAFAQKLAGMAELARDTEALKRAKDQVKALVQEYFESEDIHEARLAIEEMKAPHYHLEIVKQLISSSMDRTSRERELTSYMLSSLTGNTLAADEVEKGFEVLLQRVEDMYNDVPHILEFLSCFVARAIVDECLPPAFLARANISPHDMGYDVVMQARVLLEKPNHQAQLAHVWGPGDGRSVYDLKQEVRDFVAEFFVSYDVNEAIASTKTLNAPHFLHEVVKRFVVVSFEKKEEEVEKAIGLLARLVREGVCSVGQMKLGMKRVEDQLTDLQLDAPAAPRVFARIREAITPLL